MPRRLIRLAPLALLLAMPAGTAEAQAAGNAAREACRADYQRLCAGVSPGGGRVRACLERNAPSLSPACRTALSEAGTCRPQPAR
jgi:hypothetical protein